MRSQGVPGIVLTRRGLATAHLTAYECILIISIDGQHHASHPPATVVASSKRNYGEFPARVQETLGFELFLVQTGQHPPSAKPLKGIGSGVLELVEDYDGDLTGLSIR